MKEVPNVKNTKESPESLEKIRKIAPMIFAAALYAGLPDTVQAQDSDSLPVTIEQNEFFDFDKGNVHFTTKFNRDTGHLDAGGTLTVIEGSQAMHLGVATGGGAEGEDGYAHLKGGIAKAITIGNFTFIPSVEGVYDIKTKDINVFPKLSGIFTVDDVQFRFEGRGELPEWSDRELRNLSGKVEWDSNWQPLGEGEGTKFSITGNMGDPVNNPDDWNIMFRGTFKRK